MLHTVLQHTWRSVLHMCCAAPTKWGRSTCAALQHIWRNVLRCSTFRGRSTERPHEQQGWGLPGRPVAYAPRPRLRSAGDPAGIGSLDTGETSPAEQEREAVVSGKRKTGDWAVDNWEAIMKMRPLIAPMKRCSIRGCERERRAKGLCLAHYKQARVQFDDEFRIRQQGYAARAKERQQQRQQQEDERRLRQLQQQQEGRQEGRQEGGSQPQEDSEPGQAAPQHPSRATGVGFSKAEEAWAALGWGSGS